MLRDDCPIVYSAIRIDMTGNCTTDGSMLEISLDNCVLVLVAGHRPIPSCVGKPNASVPIGSELYS